MERKLGWSWVTCLVPAAPGAWSPRVVQLHLGGLLPSLARGPAHPPSSPSPTQLPVHGDLKMRRDTIMPLFKEHLEPLFIFIFLNFYLSVVGKEPACQCRRHEIQIWSLCQEDPLEKKMTTHSSILAWRIPMDRGAWQATVHGVAKSWTQLKWLST